MVLRTYLILLMLRQGYSSWHRLLIECSQKWLHSYNNIITAAKLRIPTLYNDFRSIFKP